MTLHTHAAGAPTARGQRRAPAPPCGDARRAIEAPEFRPGCSAAGDGGLVSPTPFGSDAPHIVNISGGKDSTACYLLAIERGRPFRAVSADTGHEHPLTYEFVNRLAERTGGPAVEWVREDFTDRMAKKRAFIETKWREQGVPESRVVRALEALQPTGIPFLDLVLWKGRFPSTKARFCTEELKHRPIHDQVINPILREHGRLIQWTGERREESPARAKLPRVQAVRWSEPRGVAWFFRPILHWGWNAVFWMHERHGLKPNPLYSAGMGRVGCFPCVFAAKAELAAIAARFPEAFERVREWESLAAETSKRGVGTFFAADKTPRGAAMAAAGVTGAVGGPQYPDALEVAEWSRTARGGRQFDLLNDLDASAACSSHYGLCE